MGSPRAHVKESHAETFHCQITSSNENILHGNLVLVNGLG